MVEVIRASVLRNLRPFGCRVQAYVRVPIYILFLFLNELNLQNMDLLVSNIRN